ncbi:MAG: hypothetical protein WB819_19515 [Terriglobia bacterium]|jgi:hypothetical protein
MLKRCSYLIPTFLLLIWSAPQARAIAPQYQSAFMRVGLAANQPAFVTLAVDSLGQKKLSVNPLRPPAVGKTRYKALFPLSAGL